MQKKCPQKLDMTHTHTHTHTHRVGHNETQITDLKQRSMNTNILIHGVQEKSHENLPVVIRDLFNTELGIPNVSFASIHRMGKPPSPKDSSNESDSEAPALGAEGKKSKPRIIVARLTNPAVKQDILSKASSLRLNFKVTSQSPEELRDARSRLYYVKEDYDAKEVDCQIRGSNLVFKSTGNIFREKVSLPTPETLLTASEPEIKEKLDKIVVHKGDIYHSQGNHIASFAAKVRSYKEVSDFTMKVLSSANAVPANSNVLVYKFTDSNGVDHDGWCNDREFGAGQDILRHAKSEECDNFAVIMSRKVGEHLGFKRHKVFQDNAYSAIEKTQ